MKERALERPRRRWKDNIKNLTFINRMGEVWTGLIWLRRKRETRRVVGCCEHGNEPSGSINCGEFFY
jgi:hypothetical protein